MGIIELLWSWEGVEGMQGGPGTTDVCLTEGT